MPIRVKPTLPSPQASPTKPPTARLTVGDILTALPNLSKKDLTAIQIAVEQELVKGIGIDEDLFYSVFEVANQKPIKLSKFASSANGSLWLKNQSFFMSLVDELFVTSNIDQTRVMLKALKRFLIEMLIEDIKERFMLVSLKTISQELGNIEAVVDRSFPGYLKNGLGHLIVSQLKR